MKDIRGRILDVTTENAIKFDAGRPARSKKKAAPCGTAKFREETSKMQRAEARYTDKVGWRSDWRKNFFAMQHFGPPSVRSVNLPATIVLP